MPRPDALQWGACRVAGWLAVCALSTTSPAAVTFFASPAFQPPDPQADLAFQAALTQPFTEFDLQQIGQSYIVEPSSLLTGAARVRPNLLDVNGANVTDLSTNGNRLIELHSMLPTVAGIMEGPAILNRTATITGDVVGAGVEFTFSEPVEGFGTWILDDFLESNGFVLQVTEIGGATRVSPLMDSGNGATLAIDGFLGAVSDVGIVKVVVQQQTLAGRPSSADFFYLDHVQVGGRFVREVCDNGIDDDGDGQIDCADPKCFGKPGCTRETDCGDGRDDDGDGTADCADTDCLGQSPCTTETVCDDSVDNDNDGLIDCADPDCFGEPGCSVEALCQDGIDNDGDCLVDGADPDCRAEAVVFVESTLPETLRDGSVYGKNGMWVDSNVWPRGYIGRYSEGLAWMVSKFKLSNYIAPGTPAADIRSALLSVPITDMVHTGNPTGMDFVLHHFATQDPAQVTTADYHTFTPALTDYGVVIARHAAQPDCLRKILVDVTSAVCGDLEQGRAVSSFRLGADPATTVIGPGLTDLYSLPTADNSEPCYGPVGDAAHRNVMKLIIQLKGRDVEADCGDGIDNDGDGYIDCEDADCYDVPACASHEICGDGTDDNGDGLTDCDDPQCATAPCCAGKCHSPPQDIDGDEDVDLADFGEFQACFNSPNRPYAQVRLACRCMDADADHDVDLADFLAFQASFNGPNRMPVGAPVWEAGRPVCSIVLPSGDARAARLAGATMARHLRDFYDVELPIATDIHVPGTYIVLGTPASNPSLAQLVQSGLQLTDADIGDEGFQLLTHKDSQSRYLVVFGKTPRAIKHGCQELVFYHISATADGGEADWPLDIVMKPELAYRGSYMLPCWAQHDSIDSWKRVLLFNSELTLNRCWFWLDGFPVAGHTGAYAGTPLANDQSVQTLIDLVNDEDMRFYIGGGWMTWHHAQAVGLDPVNAREYYFDYLRTFHDVGGFYFEATGEGGEAGEWWLMCESLREMIRQVLAERPGFEVSVAIGRFNNRRYLELMSVLDPKRTFWWWCWGDPLGDEALDLYPSVLAWHTVVQMSSFHGSVAIPTPAHRRLSGVSTSYDPGMGFGNPWNGGSTLGGAAGPRDFDPRTSPYFPHEYLFRERCWNTRITSEEFSRRLGRRLFDADMPRDSIDQYLKLAGLCWPPAQTDLQTIEAMEAFVAAHAGRGTPRNRDTLQRMAEAISGLRQVNGLRAASVR
jgi:hypothetical protein